MRTYTLARTCIHVCCSFKHANYCMNNCRKKRNLHIACSRIAHIGRKIYRTCLHVACKTCTDWYGWEGFEGHQLLCKYWNSASVWHQPHSTAGAGTSPILQPVPPRHPLYSIDSFKASDWHVSDLGWLYPNSRCQLKSRSALDGTGIEATATSPTVPSSRKGLPKAAF